MNLGAELKRIMQGEVLDDTESRERCARDTSLFRVLPAAVVAPKNTDDVRALVQYAGTHPGVSLTARSGGTGMDGGALSESIVVDFTKYFTAVRGFGADFGIVQPGVFYRDFERETRKRSLLMPSYPASREICTVGGMVANNAGGELTLSYGKTADYVKALRVVLSDGNEYEIRKLSRQELDAKLLQKNFEGDIYRGMYRLVTKNIDTIANARPRVSKNSSGYALWDIYDPTLDTFDLTRLFVGAQGTLGLTTEITFSLVRPPVHSQMVVVFLDTFERLGELVQKVLEFSPTTFESYDDNTMRLALRFGLSFARRLGILKMARITINNIPAGLSLLSHGIPKLVLQITFAADTPDIAHEKGKQLAEALREFTPRFVHLTRSPAEVDEYWMIRRESFNLLRTKVRGKKTAPFIDDIVVSPDVLPEFLPKLEEILREYRRYMVHNIAGHIGNGNFHIIPLMDLSDPRVVEVIPEIAHRVYDLVLSYKGSITGEHNDGIIRTPFLRQEFGDAMVRLFEETKHLFDPKNIFNPGKKVGGTLEYALSHIAVEPS